MIAPKRPAPRGETADPVDSMVRLCPSLAGAVIDKLYLRLRSVRPEDYLPRPEPPPASTALLLRVLAAVAAEAALLLERGPRHKNPSPKWYDSLRRRIVWAGRIAAAIAEEGHDSLEKRDRDRLRIWVLRWRVRQGFAVFRGDEAPAWLRRHVPR